MSLQLQSNWSQVYVDQFISIRTLNASSIYSNSLEILSISTNIPTDDEVWDEMDIEELNEYINSILWLKSEPSKLFKRVINDLEIVDINKITFGEFLDLEYLFTDYYTNFTKICATLYRRE